MRKNTASVHSQVQTIIRASYQSEISYEKMFYFIFLEKQGHVTPDFVLTRDVQLRAAFYFRRLLASRMKEIYIFPIYLFKCLPFNETQTGNMEWPHETVKRISRFNIL